MTTTITGLHYRQTEADNPDITINTASEDRLGDTMVSVRVDFEDGHSTIATMTVTKTRVLIAADMPIKEV